MIIGWAIKISFSKIVIPKGIPFTVHSTVKYIVYPEEI
jgi:hypothetical protein